MREMGRRKRVTRTIGSLCVKMTPTEESRMGPYYGLGSLAPIGPNPSRDGDPDLGQGRRAPGSPREWGFAVLSQRTSCAVVVGPQREKNERKKENTGSYLQSENKKSN
jgi:hypothetical protein